MNGGHGLLCGDLVEDRALWPGQGAALAARWATTSVERTTRDAGQPGVRLRCYLDLRQPLDASGQAPAH
ncbi:DUF6207 family protein [Streptomyces sp. NPDC048405]|uniref:DUF6207 family protein n=1 Tax=unclassified Streptomyces TaxID=2593676 RepID=UPI00371D4242|nr:DUF6207 family protein [Streptomyces sp. NBC_01124]WSU05885.1 DUF6207 family protein [Streptomyces sp. NBC_01124]